jgi:hypothetical protein
MREGLRVSIKGKLSCGEQSCVLCVEEKLSAVASADCGGSLQLYAKTPCFSAFLTKSGTLKKMVLDYIQPPIAPPNHVRIS